MSATVSLRIVGENGQVVGVIRATKKELSDLGTGATTSGKQVAASAKQVDALGTAAENTGRRTRASRKDVEGLGNTARNTGAQVDQASKQIDGFGAVAERSHRRSSLLAGTLGSIKGLLAGYAGLQGVQALGRSLDTYSDIVGKLAQVADGEVALANAKAKTFDISQRYYQQLDATVTLYARSKRALDEYGFSQEKSAKLTETVSAALLLDRATVQESASAVLQLSQALGAGALRGEEFNAVNEAAPSLMRALAQSLGVTRGELKKLAEDGALTTDVLVAAFTGERAAGIIAEASEVPLTIGRAWQTAKNDMVKFFGEADQSISASGGIANAIAFLGKNIQYIAVVAGLAGGAYTVKLLAALLRGAVVFATTTAAQARFALSLAAMEGLSTRAAVAQVGLAASSRALGAAMAFVGGPIGLAVIGLTALVVWLIRAGDQSEETARQIALNFQSAKQALDEFNAAPSANNFDNLIGADISGAIAEAKAQLELLKAAAQDAQGAYERSVGRMGDAGGVMAARLAAANEELALQRLRVEALERSYEGTISKTADIIQGMGGLETATPAARREIEQLARSMIDSETDFDTFRPKIVDMYRDMGNLTAANHAAAASFNMLRTSMAGGEFIEKMSEQLQRQQVRLRGITQGARSASRVELGYAILEEQKKAGRPLSQSELAGMYSAWKRVADVSDEADAAQKRATESTRAATRQSRDFARETKNAAEEVKRLNEARADFVRENAQLAADLGDPLQQARFEYDQALAQARDAGRKGEATPEALVERERLLAEQYRRTTAEIRERQNVLGRVQEDYRAEISLSGLSAAARRIEEQVIRAVNEAKAEGIELAPQEIENLRQVIAESEAMIQARDAQRAYAEDVKNAWVGAATAGARAWGDFAARGFKDFKSFTRSIKDIFKRLVSDLITMMADRALVQPMQQWLSQIASGGFAQAGGNGAGGGGILQSVMSLFGGGGNGSADGFWNSLFGRGQQTPSGAATAASSGLFEVGVFGGYSTPPIAQGAGSAGGGGFGGLSANPYMAGLAGALYGWNQGGDTIGKGLGAASYGVAGYAAATGLAAGGAAIAGGAGLAGAASAGFAAIPVVGWIALAAIAIDKISGGKLFGTKFKRESSALQIDFSSQGANGFTSVTESRQRSLFRGRRWRTTTTGLNDEAQQAVDETFQQISDTVNEAARTLAITAPELLSGTFRQEFDKNGNLKSEFGTIAGRVYKEGQEAFVKRLLSENLINVAKQIGSADEIERIAETYRDNVEGLSEFATLIVAIQGDIKQATALWTDRGEGMLTRVVDLMEDLARGGETLAETYQRVTQGAREYGSFIAGIDKQIRVSGLNDVQRAQLDIELQYRDQVKQANELARALGLSGARSEDLAKIEQLRAISMAQLQRQIENQRNTFLNDLSLSNLSPLRDDQKLGEGMRLLREAVASNDLQRAQQLSQTVLGLGRNLFASGADYNALYEEVTGLVGQVGANLSNGFNADQLDEIADLLTGMPDEIARAIFNSLFQLQRVSPTLPPVLVTPPAPPPTNSGGGGNQGGGSTINPSLGELITHLQTIAQNTASVAKTNTVMAQAEQRKELRGVGESR